MKFVTTQRLGGIVHKNRATNGRPYRYFIVGAGIARPTSTGTIQQCRTIPTPFLFANFAF